MSWVFENLINVWTYSYRCARFERTETMQSRTGIQHKEFEVFYTVRSYVKSIYCIVWTIYTCTCTVMSTLWDVDGAEGGVVVMERGRWWREQYVGIIEEGWNYRRQGKGRCDCLGDRICSIHCRANCFALVHLEETVEFILFLQTATLP